MTTTGTDHISTADFMARMQQYGVEELGCSTIVDGMPPEIARRLHPNLGEIYHGPDVYGNTDTGIACDLIKQEALKEPGHLTSLQRAVSTPVLRPVQDDQPVQEHDHGELTL